jgi:hypothetical protein
MDASTLDVEGNAVDVVIRIVEGEITYTGEVVIEGNVETRDNVIRRDDRRADGRAAQSEEVRARPQAHLRSSVLGTIARRPRGGHDRHPRELLRDVSRRLR